MKTTILTAISFMAAVSLFADGTNFFTDDKLRASYALGMALGHNLTQQQLQQELDPDWVARGIKDVLSGGPPLLTTEQMQTTLRQFQQDLRQKLATRNKAEGEAFLATNKNNPGVVTLPDGLQYKVISEGLGETPAATDIVTVNYSGKFLNGEEFDSSYKRGQPAQFQVGGVIPGWTEALQKMKVGSKWQLFIPSYLAYGEQGNRGIPPNSTLIFDVELLSVKKLPPPSAPTASSNPPLTSDIIKVPSAEEIKKGAKIEVIKPEDMQKAQSQTNSN